MADWMDMLNALTEKMKLAVGVEDVLELCPHQSAGDGFWPGDGDDLLGVLYDAGWTSVDYRAPYYWCIQAPDGSFLTYVEGDLYRGNSMPPRTEGN